MTAKEYKSICRRVGGENVLIRMLTLIGNIGDMQTECDLAKHLKLKKPLFDLFDHPPETFKLPDGKTYFEHNGPYLELQKVYERIKITYGICYGGTCGEGGEYWFIKSPDGKWAIDPDAPQIMILH